MNTPLIFAFVGMPGCGKSSAISYLSQKGISFVRFGDVTEEELAKQSLPITPENEKKVREELRVQFGMDVYAKHSLEKIQSFLATASIVGIDGLYSWEEYTFLKNQLGDIRLVYIFAPASVRYQRLLARPTRPLTIDEARARDIAEIEHLNKGGPIAMADIVIDNSGSQEALKEQLNKLSERYEI